MSKSQKIRIRLKAYDHKALDQSAAKIVETATIRDAYPQKTCRHSGTDCEDR